MLQKACYLMAVIYECFCYIWAPVQFEGSNGTRERGNGVDLMSYSSVIQKVNRHTILKEHLLQSTSNPRALARVFLESRNFFPGHKTYAGENTFIT